LWWAGSSGKLTPTRQLLLASPARRQLNFEEGTRSRKVSETIKEAKVRLTMKKRMPYTFFYRRLRNITGTDTLADQKGDVSEVSRLQSSRYASLW
jgi:hypothetical protein